MQVVGGKVMLSAGDLVGFLACRRLTRMDHDVARGLRDHPKKWEDPALELLQERGLEHERQYVEWLAPRSIMEIPHGDNAVDATIECMKRGVEVIVQGSLRHGRWRGRPDLLRRVETPSELGSWSYEVIDTKLAAATKAGTILQLCLYSDIVRRIQGCQPEQFYVVAPGDEGGEFDVQPFRFDQYGAFYRLVRDQMDLAVPENPELDDCIGTGYPDPRAHCDVCRWYRDCDKKLRRDDSTWFVAGLTQLNKKDLDAGRLRTLKAFAQADEVKAVQSSDASLERARKQAVVQLRGRTTKLPVYELRPMESARGLAKLPPPSKGDIFFDIEGDRLGLAEGREFLFGLTWVDDAGQLRYEAIWATTLEEEYQALRDVIALIKSHWRECPDMHVYHYAPYEPSALKRLVGRHATCGAELDEMLRAELFVDLWSITRQALWASVERYSIKDLEQFYGYERKGELKTAGHAVRAVQLALGRGAHDSLTVELREKVEAYNADDCVSTYHLHRWLEKLRPELEALEGQPVPRPTAVGDGNPSEKEADRQARVRAVSEKLLEGVPLAAAERNEDQQARWVLAQILEYHRRETNVAFWERFRLGELSADELVEERAGLGQMTLVGEAGQSARGLPIHRYCYPEQETDLRPGRTLRRLGDGTEIGTVKAIDYVERTIDVQKRGDTRDEHPEAVFNHRVVTGPMADSLLRFGRHINEHGFESPGAFVAAAQLLLRASPALELTCGDGESVSALVRRVGPDLKNTILPIQGPPGAGKTYTASRMILDLVRAGRKVGVTAVSHKVIRNVLDGVAEAAEEESLEVRCMHKGDGKTTGRREDVALAKTTKALLGGLEDGTVNVAGATVFLWSREDALGTLDVLFVDEAGQMALANALAVAPAAHSVVLLGDPQQLEQPQQGAHPEGTDISALEHILYGARTMPMDKGVFLDETWRLAPTVCSFTSELFYENRLQPRPELSQQAIEGADLLPSGSGLFYVPVHHEGNQNVSRSECAAVEKVVAQLLDGASWRNARGEVARIVAEDILVVAPYNAQVDLLSTNLSETGVRVGTVDKFQGQEAPAVIYSMATSTPADAPRGMEFLYSPNRFNVATSRARCAVVLVAAPALFSPECRSPRHMLLANVLCRYLELATEIVLSD